VIAKNTSETTFQHSAVEEAGHDVVKESSPETMRAFESFLPHRLDFLVKGVHQEIQGSGLRMALLVDGDGHGTGIEARNMPIAGEALRINRLSGLGFVGSGCTDGGIDSSDNFCLRPSREIRRAVRVSDRES
jgi:hypothetical protein